MFCLLSKYHIDDVVNDSKWFEAMAEALMLLLNLKLFPFSDTVHILLVAAGPLAIYAVWHGIFVASQYNIVW